MGFFATNESDTAAKDKANDLRLRKIVDAHNMVAEKLAKTASEVTTH